MSYNCTGDVTSSIPVFHPGNARGVNHNLALAQGSVGASSRRVSPFYGSKESRFKMKSYLFRNFELYWLIPLINNDHNMGICGITGKADQIPGQKLGQKAVCPTAWPRNEMQHTRIIDKDNHQRAVVVESGTIEPPDRIHRLGQYQTCRFQGCICRWPSALASTRAPAQRVRARSS